ncbi:hypothetical protein PENTCL1PPCAC_21083, partial [Pristionchus entomophagus]
ASVRVSFRWSLRRSHSFFGWKLVHGGNNYNAPLSSTPPNDLPLQCDEIRIPITFTKLRMSWLKIRRVATMSER